MKSSKSNINFDFIEFEISEQDLELFKMSISQGCIRRVDQLTANKWHYLLKYDDKLLEVEITYNKNSIKQFQCACGARSSGKMCKHVQLACYWHVVTINSQNKSKSLSRPFTSNQLEHSSEEDLRYYLSFLSRQSQINKEWLHFFDSARSTSPHPIEKYITLIDHFVQYIDQHTRHSISKIKYLLQFYEELYYISFYHYKQSNIEEAISALLAGIHKLQEWHIQLDWKNQSRFVNINEKFHSALEQFLSSIIAPRALSKILKMISGVMIRPEYLILNSKSNLFKLVKHLNKKSNHDKSYFNDIILKLDQNIREEYKYNLLNYLYEEYPAELKGYLIKKEITKSVYWVIGWLDWHHKKMDTDYLLDLYCCIYDASTIEMKSHIALKIADLYPQNHKTDSGNLLIKLYLDTGHLKLLDVYFKDQTFTHEKFDLFLRNLQTELSDKKLTQTQKFELAIYSKQWTLLIGLFQHSEDLEMLLKYDSRLPEEFHAQLIELYIAFTKKYLESHVGHKSHVKLEQITRHIKALYSSKLQAAYAKEIKQFFPTRKLISLK